MRIEKVKIIILPLTKKLETLIWSRQISFEMARRVIFICWSVFMQNTHKKHPLVRVSDALDFVTWAFAAGFVSQYVMKMFMYKDKAIWGYKDATLESKAIKIQ